MISQPQPTISLESQPYECDRRQRRCTVIPKDRDNGGRAVVTVQSILRRRPIENTIRYVTCINARTPAEANQTHTLPLSLTVSRSSTAHERLTSVTTAPDILLWVTFLVITRDDILQFEGDGYKPLVSLLLGSSRTYAQNNP